ncbi:hypothetical protein QT381_10215 [Galbitalea sp. SE-J8]|uniref:hypothetical protein n=1 Tax=Galbitalea sp. SE-J8 TaxID=3054952 RepID=UPI00259C73FE|nr:hypothetical protein [Galbitalea sp. SE-J8]MDM4763382.1 hypothetical protein [Galbitalea sp. SE-J8]
MNRLLRTSPQSLDPLSWYSRPLFAGSFGALILFYGLASVTSTWRDAAAPLLDIVAVALVAAASFLVQVRTGPFRRPFGSLSAIPVLALAIAGLVVSTCANYSATTLVQYWWAPAGVAIVIATLAPHSSVLQVLVYGGVLSVASGVAGGIAFSTDVTVWPPVSAAVIAMGTTLIGLVASAVFIVTVVARTRELFVDAGTVPERVDGALADETALIVERHLLARLGARVAPFLEQIADAGVVTDDDRALAGQLARRLRSDLKESVNRSWLESVAAHGRMFVVDPDHRADRMNSAQRAALRGLLTAALRSPGADAGSLFIELRGQPDGSTAVALSLDLDLPEGRRSTMLAPYYLALQTTVDDLDWDTRRGLLTFAVRRDEGTGSGSGPHPRP